MKKIKHLTKASLKLLAGLFRSKGKDPATATASPAAMAALQDKKLLFIGNSYTMNGFAVIPKDCKTLTQKQRSNDHGFFYQLCKTHGIRVSVTNWCFSGHNISQTFGGPCTAKGKACTGKDHAAYLTDRNFDYVIIQCYKEEEYTQDLLSYLAPVTSLFREANPNVKFLLLVPHMACEKNYLWTQDLPAMQQAGFTICNWGKMLHDICSGTVTVPHSQQKYDRLSFVVSVSKEDGYHENMLAGYLTALMTYCAITGDSAVGQSYHFCDDPSLDLHFCLDAHKQLKYTYFTNTNFPEIFRSPGDMKGLQELTDRYLAEFNS